MITWNYNPNEYTARNFTLIPEGNHKVSINNVTEKIFNSGNEGFEITLNVEGFDSKLWLHLIFDHKESEKTNQRIGMFFDSFAIQDHDLSRYSDWIGKDGVVRVRHNVYNGCKTASVAFCISRNQQGKLSNKQSKTFSFANVEEKTNREINFNGFSF